MNRISSTDALYVCTLVTGIALVSAIVKVAQWSLEPTTWHVPTNDGDEAASSAHRRYRRGIIASMTNSVLQFAGQLFLQQGMLVDVHTVVVVYQVVWGNVASFVTEHVIVSDEGLDILQRKGLSAGMKDAFRRLPTQRFMKHLVVVCVDACLVSLLMSKALPVVNEIALPPWYPKVLLEFLVAGAIGTGIHLSFGNFLRANWVHSDESPRVADGIIALLATVTAVYYFVHEQTAAPDTFLESKTGRAVVLACTMQVVFLMQVLQSRPSKTALPGIAIYAMVTLGCCAVLVSQAKRWQAAGGVSVMAMLHAPVALAL